MTDKIEWFDTQITLRQCGRLTWHWQVEVFDRNSKTIHAMDKTGIAMTQKGALRKARRYREGVCNQ